MTDKFIALQHIQVVQVQKVEYRVFTLTQLVLIQKTGMQKYNNNGICLYDASRKENNNPTH